MQASARRGKQGIGANPSFVVNSRTVGPDTSDRSVADRVAELSLTVGELTPQIETDIRELLDVILTHARFEYAFQVVAYACALEKERDARLLALVLDLILQRIRDDPRAEVHDCVRLCRIIGTEVLPTLQDPETLDSNDKPVVGISLFRLYLFDRCKLFMRLIWQAKEQAISSLNELSTSAEAAQSATVKWINFMEFIDGLFGQYVLGEDIVYAVIDQQLASAKWTNRELNKIIDILSPSRRFAQLCKTNGYMDSYRPRIEGLEKTGALDPEMYTRLMSYFSPFNDIAMKADFGTRSKSGPDKNEIHTHPLVHETAKVRVSPGNIISSPPSNSSSIPQSDPSLPRDNKLHVDATTPLTAVIAFFTQVAQPLIENFTSELESATFSENPISDTAISEVWRATLRRGVHVAVKCIKPTVSGNDKAVKHTARELAAWSQQQHVNVLQLLGVALYRGKLAMVSEWMERGSITNVVNQNPDVDRYNLCMQVARVVAWLYRKGLIHGDLKGANILMSNDGIPKVTDFGLTVMSEGVCQFSETFAGGGTMRWMAPELFQESGRKSFKTDVYALGMTLLEILTGQHPFPEITSPQQIIKAVSLDKRIPKRPGYLAEKNTKNNIFWDAMVRCWVYDPGQRATAEEVETLISSAEDTAQGLMKSVASKRGSMCSSCTFA